MDLIVLNSLANIDSRNWRLVVDQRRTRLEAFALRHRFTLEPEPGQELEPSGGIRAPFPVGPPRIDPRVRLLPGIGALLVPRDLMRRLPEKDDIETFGVVGAGRVSSTPVVAGFDNPADHDADTASALNTQGVNGAGVLVGFIDSGCNLNVGPVDACRQFRVIRDQDQRVLQVEHVDSFGDNHRHRTTAEPRLGWNHGSTICRRLLGVANRARIAMAAALTEVDGQGMPFGDRSQAACALDWLVTAEFREGTLGCDVVNASLEVAFDVDEQSQLVTFGHALRMAAFNQRLIVCAAGNTNNQARPLDLACAESTLAVGAALYDRRQGELIWNGITKYDVDRKKPDVLAFGETTSYACPQVTAAAALILQACPGIPLWELKTRLLRMATKPVADAPTGIHSQLMDLASYPEALQPLQ